MAKTRDAPDAALAFTGLGPDADRTTVHLRSGAHGPDEQRLERAINRARWAGAVVAFALGPLFPNLGAPFVVALGGSLLAYACVMQLVISRSAGRPLGRAFHFAFWADNAVILLAMLTFAPDPAWTTFVFGILVIIIGGFRYGGVGALVSAGILGLGYIVIGFYRELAFGHPVEISRVAGHLTAYLLAALLMSGILRELHSLRGLFEPLLSAQGDLGEGILVHESGRPVYWNEAIARLTGYGRDEIAALSSIGELVAPQERAAVTKLLADRSRKGKIETLIARKDGAQVPVELAFAPIASALGPREVVLVRAVTEARRASDALRDQALHDRLTGLPNQTLLDDRLEQAIAVARRLGGSCSLLLVGLDNLTDVNEIFGHHAADTLMPQIAGRLVGEVRAVDTVARLGSDEFVVLLPTTDAEGAVLVARKIGRAMERPFAVGDRSVGLGAGIGIASYPASGSQPQELLRRAEIAMQAAKSSGQGYVAYAPAYEPGQIGLLVVPALREAIERDQLLLHYQPEVRVRDGGVVRMEALIRWDRGGELVAPAEFISLAEHRGLIGALTLWVIGTALRDQRTWSEVGWPVEVAVNASVRNLLDPEFPPAVARLCRSTGTDPRFLTLEITESVLMADPERIGRTLELLRRMGVRLAIDDFGTGYSSLAYLDQLPVQSLKVDRSFVARLGAKKGSYAIVRAIVDLGEAFGFEVVAEGIEDQPTLDRLAAIGVQTAQGYHIARPMALPDLLTWLHGRSPVSARETPSLHLVRPA